MALSWILGSSQERENRIPPTYPQVKEVIDTARKVSEQMKIYGHEDCSFREVLPIANIIRTEMGGFFDYFLNIAPVDLCSTLAGAIKQQAHVHRITAILAGKGYEQREIAIAAAWLNMNSSANLSANDQLDSESVASLFAIDPSQLEDIIKTAREISLFSRSIARPNTPLKKFLSLQMT